MVLDLHYLSDGGFDPSILEAKLRQRPQKSELVARSILKPGDISPSVWMKQQQLRRSVISHTLADFLQRRPSQDQLAQQRVLPVRQSEAHRLQVSDQLTHFLQSRPSRDQLVERHVLLGI